MTLSGPPEVTLSVNRSPWVSVRVEVAGLNLSPAEARDLARDLQRAGQDAERLPSLHENHVNYRRSCPLCVHEAGPSHQWQTADGEETTCADCGDTFNSPAGEDPANTLCAACADERDQS